MRARIDGVILSASEGSNDSGSKWGELICKVAGEPVVVRTTSAELEQFAQGDKFEGLPVHVEVGFDRNLRVRLDGSTYRQDRESA